MFDKDKAPASVVSQLKSNDLHVDSTISSLLQNWVDFIQSISLVRITKPF